jgi:F-box protein 21
MMATFLTTLPQELIVYTLRFLEEPRDILEAGLVCRVLNDCSEDNSIWAGLASKWSFWHHNDLRTAANSAWKLEIRRRFEADREIDETLDGLIQEPELHLLPQFRIVMGMGIEAKDRLIRHILETPDEALDVLARRYWAEKLLGACQRPLALDVVAQALHDEHIPPERLLAAVDMLTFDDMYDMEWTRKELDTLAEDFKRTYSNWETRPPRELMQLAAYFLKEDRMLQKARPYYASDYFITRTLRGPLHCGTVLVCIVLLHALVDRLGLSPFLLQVNFQPFVVVSETRSNRLEFEPSSANEFVLFDFESGPKRYIDLLDAGDNVQKLSSSKLLETLGGFLGSLGHDTNLRRMLTRVDRGDPGSTVPAQDLQVSDVINTVGWIRTLFSPSDVRVRAFLATYNGLSIWDTYLASNFFIRMNIRPQAALGMRQLAELQDAGSESRIVYSRARTGDYAPKFKVGDVAKHVRYGYVGFITGWSVYQRVTGNRLGNYSGVQVSAAHSSEDTAVFYNFWYV